MKLLLASPVHWPWSRWFLVLEWTGPRSGRRYRTPVCYVTDGDYLLITTGDAWWKNLAESPEVLIWWRGRERRAAVEPIVDENLSVELHERMFRTRPFFASLAGIARSAGRAGILRSVRAGRTLIRVRPA